MYWFCAELFLAVMMKLLPGAYLESNLKLSLRHTNVSMTVAFRHGSIKRGSLGYTGELARHARNQAAIQSCSEENSPMNGAIKRDLAAFTLVLSLAQIIAVHAAEHGTRDSFSLHGALPPEFRCLKTWPATGSPPASSSARCPSARANARSKRCPESRMFTLSSPTPQ